MDLRHYSVNEMADILIDKLGDFTDSLIRPHREQIWIATFGFVIEDLNSKNFPSETRSDYAGLYGWVTEEMLGRLSRFTIVNPRIIDEDRNEEMFSLRVGFKWDTSEYPLDFGEMGVVETTGTSSVQPSL